MGGMLCVIPIRIKNQPNVYLFYMQNCNFTWDYDERSVVILLINILNELFTIDD